MSNFIKIPIKKDLGIDVSEKGSCGRVFNISDYDTFMCYECERKFSMIDTIGLEYPTYCPYCGLEFTHVYECSDWAEDYLNEASL